MSKLWGWFAVLIGAVVFILSCSHLEGIKERQLASVDNYLENNYKKEKELTRQEEDQLWHLSEGADVYPYEWLVRLPNIVRGKQRQENGKKDFDPYFEKFYERYGIIKDYYAVQGKSEYLIPWVGLSASWSEVSEEKRDVTRTGLKRMGHSLDNLPQTYQFPGEKHKSIVMMGTSCILCHSSKVNYGSKDIYLEGTGNVHDIRGFFKDMAGSTLAMMLQEKHLARFLEKFDYSKEEADFRASIFSIQLKNKLKLGFITRAIRHVKGHIKKVRNLDANGEFSPEQISEARKVLRKIAGLPIKGAKSALGLVTKPVDPITKELKKSVIQKKLLKKDNYKVVAEHLEKLLLMTVLKGEKTLSPELKGRMEWLAKTMASYPGTTETLPGFGRTDAFGRIGNTVARMKDPVKLVANVSNPSVWGMKYRSTFHWNGNTNSVLMRNIGQSFGLGAIQYQEDGVMKATTNFKNLLQLEKLIYKVPVPRWTELVSDDIDQEKVIQGCNVYVNTCMGCHTSQKRPVGPQKNLLEAKVFSLKAIGTDPNQAVVQTKPIGGEPLRRVLFSFTQNVRDDYKRLRPDRVDEQSGVIRGMESAYILRGQELFRDTYLGEFSADKSYSVLKGQPQLITDYMNAKTKTGYSALHLAGAWSSPPFLHNGSVPSMWDLLQPPSQRPKHFAVGHRAYDAKKMGFIQEGKEFDCSPQSKSRSNSAHCFVVNNRHVESFYKKISKSEKVDKHYKWIKGNGNSNLGHNFGTDLSDEEKWSLIEFLKVLEPEAPYAWAGAGKYYQINNKTCSAPN